jgi:hypothetical protein
MLTFQQFKQKLEDRYNSKQYIDLRVGQILMNLLYSIWPEQYNHLTGTKDDCFYDNAKVPGTLKVLEEIWPK